MDLYYAVTNYHLLCCILHKIKYNNNSAILLLSEYLIENNSELPKRIEESKLFENVIIVDKPEFYDSDELLTKKQLDKRISDINKKIENKYSKIIKFSNNKYICVDFDEIGIYLISNKIKYNYFEDACGILSREELILRILHIRKKFIKRLKALGNNENIIKRYGSLKDQKPGYYNEKDVDFCVKDILENLSQKNIQTILKIYNVDKIKMSSKKYNLLLTMHYDEIMKKEDQINIYKSIIDYFTSENELIIIKPHPADYTNNYQDIFKGARVLPRGMPSELFPYCIKEKINKGLTCYSTSVYSLNNIIKTVICFDSRIDDTYKYFEKYYAVVEFLKSLRFEKKINLKFININELQFEKLIEEYIPNSEDFFTFNSHVSNNFYIVNRITESLKGKKVISLEYDKNASSLIHINKKSKTKNEDIFISLYNIEYNSKFNINKKLKYSEVELNIEYINENNYKEVIYNIVKSQSKNIENKIKQYEDKILELENDIEVKNSNLKHVYSSSSWKITTPIRKIADILRKIRKRI